MDVLGARRDHTPAGLAVVPKEEQNASEENKEILARLKEVRRRVHEMVQRRESELGATTKPRGNEGNL